MSFMLRLLDKDESDYEPVTLKVGISQFSRLIGEYMQEWQYRETLLHSYRFLSGQCVVCEGTDSKETKGSWILSVLKQQKFQIVQYQWDGIPRL